MVATCRARASPFCVDVRDIANRPLGLSMAAEYDLLRSCGSSDEQEAEIARMILGHVYLQPIIWMAYRYEELGLSFRELTSDGAKGLNQTIHACHKSPRSFRLHAFQQIQNAMENTLSRANQER